MKKVASGDKISQEPKVKKIKQGEGPGQGAAPEHNMLAGQSPSEGPSSEQTRNRTDAEHPGGSKNTWGR